MIWTNFLFTSRRFFPCLLVFCVVSSSHAELYPSDLDTLELYLHGVREYTYDALSKLDSINNKSTEIVNNTANSAYYLEELYEIMHPYYGTFYNHNSHAIALEILTMQASGMTMSFGEYLENQKYTGTQSILRDYEFYDDFFGTTPDHQHFFMLPNSLSGSYNFPDFMSWTLGGAADEGYSGFRNDVDGEKEWSYFWADIDLQRQILLSLDGIGNALTNTTEQTAAEGIVSDLETAATDLQDEADQFALDAEEFEYELETNYGSNGVPFTIDEEKEFPVGIDIPDSIDFIKGRWDYEVQPVIDSALTSITEKIETTHGTIITQIFTPLTGFLESIETSLSSASSTIVFCPAGAFSYDGYSVPENDVSVNFATDISAGVVPALFSFLWPTFGIFFCVRKTIAFFEVILS